MQREALASWLREPGAGEIRPVPLAPPGPDEVYVRTTRSAISRGTEALVYRGRVPTSQHASMRTPFQDGDFPAPNALWDAAPSAPRPRDSSSLWSRSRRRAP